MSAYDDLMTEIKSDCPGATDPLIAQHVRNAVLEFCRDTLVLKWTCPAITIQANQPLYVITPPAERSIVQVQWAQIQSDAFLTHTSQDQLDLWWHEARSSPRLFPWWCAHGNTQNFNGDDWRQYTQTRPQAYYIDRESTSYRVRLVGIPTGTIADALIARVALTPTRDSESVDDWLVEEYFDALSDGAKARLMRMPKKNWSDANTGAAYMAKFEFEKSRAKMKVSRDFIRDDESVGHVQSWP